MLNVSSICLKTQSKLRVRYRYLLVRIVSQTVVMAVTGPVEQRLERCLQLSPGMQPALPSPSLLTLSSPANNLHHEDCRDWSLFMASPDHYQSHQAFSVMALQLINPKTSRYLTQGLEIILRPN